MAVETTIKDAGKLKELVLKALGENRPPAVAGLLVARGTKVGAYHGSVAGATSGTQEIGGFVLYNQAQQKALQISADGKVVGTYSTQDMNAFRGAPDNKIPGYVKKIVLGQ